MKKYTLTLPLPPSQNKAFTRNPYTHQTIYTKIAKDYLERTAEMVKKSVKKLEIEPINKYFYLDIFWTLPRSVCDSHNYQKLLFDALERGGLVTNDRYIMSRTQDIRIDKLARVIICFSV